MPGNEALKRAEAGVLKRQSEEPQEGRERETETHPAGGQGSERDSRCVVRQRCRAGLAEKPVHLKCESDDGPRRARACTGHRTSRGAAGENLMRVIVGDTRPARRPVVKTRKTSRSPEECSPEERSGKLGTGAGARSGGAHRGNPVAAPDGERAGESWRTCTGAEDHG